MSLYITYHDLDVWKVSRILVKEIYEITSHFPENEKFGLTNQIRRGSVSIISNFSEGHGRQYKKENIQFISIALGALNELETQLILSIDLGFISEEQCGKCNDLIEQIRKLGFGYLRYLKNNTTLK